MFGERSGSVIELTGGRSPFDRWLIGGWSAQADKTPVNQRSINDLPIETYTTYSEHSLLKLKILLNVGSV
jgi:hypothetical protein